MKQDIGIAAAFAAGLEVISANSVFAEFALENSQIKVKSQE